MRRFRLLLGALVAALLAGGCGNPGAPADPPADVAVVAGDNRFTVTWTMVPNVEYWLFYAPASVITQDNWDTLPGAVLVRPAGSPTVITGVANGTTYSFMIDGRIDSGPAGSATPSMSVVPRPAGAEWTQASPLGAPSDLSGIAYGAVFVATGANGEVFTSADGAAWTAQSSGVATALSAAFYYAGNYLAAGAGGLILRSTDTVGWTQVNATGLGLNALGTNYAGTYVAVGDSGTILRSSDAQTWTAAASSGIATLEHLYGLTYAIGSYVAVGGAGTILTSADADTWTAVAPAVVGSALRSVVWSAKMNTFVAVGDGGALVTSSDGVTWTLQPQIAGAPDLRSVTYASQFVAVGASGAVYTSTDGLNWVQQAQPLGTVVNLNAVVSGNYGYAAVGTAGTNLVSH